jgi:protoheme IX farnesyltransferase
VTARVHRTPDAAGGIAAVLADVLALAKPRITLLVVLTAGAGFAAGSAARVETLPLLHLLLGTALVAAGTNGLNQVLEADVDARMRRTRGRPIPSGRLSRAAGAVLASAFGLVGLWYLARTGGPLVAALAAATLLSYAFVYTPLKRHTSLATVVGAVPGALPILGGWAAARGDLGAAGWPLFAILFLWQMPHFLALAWIHRDDYASAGIRMLSAEADGRGTFLLATLYAAALVPVALLPTILGVAGRWYFWGALFASLLLLAASGAAAARPTTASARRLFRASLLHLPVILLLLTADRTP